MNAKKLSLNPETLRSLTEQETGVVEGGAFPNWTVKYDKDCTATTSRIDTACCY